MAQALQMPLGLKFTAPEATAPPSAPPSATPAPPAPPTVVLPIAMQPRVKVGAVAAGKGPTQAAATLSESGLRTSQDFARMKPAEEPEHVREDDHAVSAFGALAMSVIGLFAWPLIAGIVALCMGVWALSEMRVTGNRGGRGPALLGIVLGLVNVGFWVVYAASRVGQEIGN